MISCNKNLLGLVCLFATALVVTAAGHASGQGEEPGAAPEMVTCTETTLKIDASNAKTENLVREIGDKCGIKVVVFGEAFDEKPIGVKFQQLPIRKGIERVLRIANLPNFVLHLDNSSPSPRIIELDIMGKKGGERQLTSGTGRQDHAASAPSPAPAPAAQPPKPKPAPGPATAGTRLPPQGKGSEKPSAADKQPAKAQEPRDDIDAAQEEFIKVMDAMMKAQEAGEEPDPAEVLRIFKQVVPPDVRDQIPPEVIRELEELQKNPPPKQ